MKAKLVGSITASQEKRVGKFYKPGNLQPELKQSRQSANKLQNKENSRAGDGSVRRSNSVGKIYSSQCSRQSESKRQQGQFQSCSKGYLNGLINYDEMEHKLSSYLNCSIRTAGRQKYNYLSDNQKTYSNHFYNYQRTRLGELPYNNNELFRKISNQKHSDCASSVPLRDINLRNSADSKEVTGKTAVVVTKEAKRGKENSIMPDNQTKQKQNTIRKQGLNMFTINHKQHKDELQNKLKKIIQNYESKNKQLSNQLQLLQVKTANQKNAQTSLKASAKQKITKEEQTPLESESYKPEFLNQIIAELVRFNLKGICLSHQCPQKQALWKSIHSQIILDEKLRIIKLFISDQNSNKVIDFINASRLKKIQASWLKTNVEQYDPFLVQKINELLSTKQPNFSTKAAAKWVADSFIKCFEESERHWLKHLSQEKLECQIKAFYMEKQITSLRKVEGLSRDLNLRDFTRYLSTLFKANLRNRNVFSMYSKVKGLPYIGRFIELLQQKVGKGSETKKSNPQK